jgi:hypothetical protein
VTTMRHLCPQELVDVVEGTATAEQAHHVRTCGSCGQHVIALREALALTGAGRVPEPPAAFWQQLRARVSEAVEREAAPPAWWRTWGWRWAPAAAVALVLVAAGIGLITKPAPRQQLPPVLGQTAVAVPEAAPRDEADDTAVGEDPSWSLVSDLSVDVSFDDVVSSGAVGMSPGGSDSALRQLDEAERDELAGLLRAEIGGPISGAAADPGA